MIFVSYYLMLWNEGRGSRKLSSTSQDTVEVESIHESQHQCNIGCFEKCYHS